MGERRGRRAKTDARGAHERRGRCAKEDARSAHANRLEYICDDSPRKVSSGSLP